MDYATDDKIIQLLRSKNKLWSAYYYMRSFVKKSSTEE